MMVIYQCEDSFDGILCGVYDAWMSRLGHANVKLQLEETGNMEMFTEYRVSQKTEEKRDKVIRAILEKVGRESYEAVFQASLSMEEDRADRIYRYLIYGFYYGSKVADMLSIPAVYDIFCMCRYVKHETHLLTGFIRFSQMEEGILMGKIGPKNDVLVLTAPHFADRLSGENWILYDEKRKKAVIHPAGGNWVMMKAERKDWDHFLNKGSDEEEYEKLWRAFHRGIAIEERKNLKTQRGHLPLRYRSYMTEFEEKR